MTTPARPAREAWFGGNRHGEQWSGGKSLDASIPRYGDANLADGSPAPTNVVLLHREVFTDVAAADVDGFVAAVAGNAVAGTFELTLDGALVVAGVGVNDVPRVVEVTVTHGSAVVAGTFRVTGTDALGYTITEDLAITAGGTTKTATTLQAFATVTSVQEIIAADASANTNIVGNADVLGLSRILENTEFVRLELEDGALATAGTIVVGAAPVGPADGRGTYLPNSTPNGALDFEVFFWVTDPDRAFVGQIVI